MSLLHVGTHRNIEHNKKRTKRKAADNISTRKKLALKIVVSEIDINTLLIESYI